MAEDEDARPYHTAGICLPSSAISRYRHGVDVEVLRPGNALAFLVTQQLLKGSPSTDNCAYRARASLGSRDDVGACSLPTKLPTAPGRDGAMP